MGTSVTTLPRHAVAVMLSSPGGAVWLAKRKKDDELTGMLECPGGAVEPTDNGFREAAVREVFEETGLRIDYTRCFNRGSIALPGWQVTLYTVKLDEREKPMLTERVKRGGWEKWMIDEVPLDACTPSVGALLSVLVHDRRILSHRQGGQL